MNYCKKNSPTIEQQREEYVAFLDERQDYLNSLQDSKCVLTHSGIIDEKSKTAVQIETVKRHISKGFSKQGEPYVACDNLAKVTLQDIKNRRYSNSFTLNDKEALHIINAPAPSELGQSKDDVLGTNLSADDIKKYGVTEAQLAESIYNHEEKHALYQSVFPLKKNVLPHEVAVAEAAADLYAAYKHKRKYGNDGVAKLKIITRQRDFDKAQEHAKKVKPKRLGKLKKGDWQGFINPQSRERKDKKEFYKNRIGNLIAPVLQDALAAEEADNMQIPKDDAELAVMCDRIAREGVEKLKVGRQINLLADGQETVLHNQEVPKPDILNPPATESILLTTQLQNSK